MGKCLICDPPEHVDDERLADHLRVLHPDDWGDGPLEWPDGGIVVVDTTLEPSTFDGVGDVPDHPR
jgi:hypothetical protein